MLKTVAIAYWTHPSGTTQALAGLMVEAMNRLGLHAQPLCIDRPEGREHARLMMNAKHLAGIVMLTPDVLSTKLGPTRLWKAVRCPVAVYCLDHPLYSFRGIQANLADTSDQDLSRLLWLFADRLHVEQFRRMLGDRGGRVATHFLPFAGPRPAQRDERFEQRRFRIVFFGNANREIAGGNIRDDVASSFAHHAGTAIPISRIEEFVDTFDRDGAKGDVIGAAVAFFGIDWTAAADPTWVKFLGELDSYIKRLRRLRIVRSLATADMHIFGHGWREVAPDLPATYHDPVPYGRQFEIFSNAQIVLNADPNWGAGAHDRVFNAMLCGAVALTQRNAYSELVFQDGFDALLYSQNGDDLTHPEVLSAHDLPSIARQGFNGATARHTWDARMRELVTMMGID